jgi:hypothetical protein
VRDVCSGRGSSGWAVGDNLERGDISIGRRPGAQGVRRSGTTWCPCQGESPSPILPWAARLLYSRNSSMWPGQIAIWWATPQLLEAQSLELEEGSNSICYVPPAPSTEKAYYQAHWQRERLRVSSIVGKLKLEGGIQKWESQMVNCTILWHNTFY